MMRAVHELVRGTISIAAGAMLAGCVVAPIDTVVPRTVVDAPDLTSVTIGGVKLHARTFGDPESPPVVVVHGGPGGDSRALLPLRALADRYFVVFYDQRGSGLSQRVTDGELTLDRFYADLDGVVDHFGRGRKVRVVGHSWGAMLASGYLGRHPEKIAQIVLAEPGFLTRETAKIVMAATHDMRPPMSFEVIRIGASAWLQSLDVVGPDDDARRDFLALALMASKFEGHPMEGYYCGRDLGTARMEASRFGARVAPALFAAARAKDGSWDVDFVRGVERFPEKVLFLVGSCNVVLGEALQRQHMKSFRRAELVVIPGAGHTMFGEKPAASIAAVREYFASEAGKERQEDEVPAPRP